MKGNKVIWAIVVCSSNNEAENIGRFILKKRLCSCYDIIPRKLARYFWPPKKNTIEESKGCLLLLETFKEKYNTLSEKVKKLHSDKEPFIAFIPLQGISTSYLAWMQGEIR